MNGWLIPISDLCPIPTRSNLVPMPATGLCNTCARGHFASDHRCQLNPHFPFPNTLIPAMATSAADTSRRMNLTPILCYTANTSLPFSVVGLKETLIDTTKGAVHLATVALSVAGSATQKVPYLGAISTVLTEVLKIIDVRGQIYEM